MDERTTTTAPVDQVELVVVPSPTDQLVDAWFIETFHNIDLPTHFHNRFYAATQDLKKRLAALER